MCRVSIAITELFAAQRLAEIVKFEHIDVVSAIVSSAIAAASLASGHVQRATLSS